MRSMRGMPKVLRGSQPFATSSTAGPRAPGKMDGVPIESTKKDWRLEVIFVETYRLCPVADISFVCRDTAHREQRIWVAM